MRSFAVSTGLAIAFWSASTFAADAGAADDVDVLLTQLSQDYSTLSTQDCALACKAYASIRRASDKICALEPGPRCNEARVKADDAQRRVQAACPDCRVATALPENDDKSRAVQPSPSPPAAGTDGASAEAESAPRKGGCASCNMPGFRPGGDLGVAVVGALAVARLLRRRRPRR